VALAAHLLLLLCFANAVVSFTAPRKAVVAFLVFVVLVSVVSCSQWRESGSFFELLGSQRV